MNKRPPTTFYWCHECKAWRDCEGPNAEDDNYWCNTCGHRIQCDECGDPWTNDHEQECRAQPANRRNRTVQV